VKVIDDCDKVGCSVDFYGYFVYYVVLSLEGAAFISARWTVGGMKAFLAVHTLKSAFLWILCQSRWRWVALRITVSFKYFLQIITRGGSRISWKRAWNGGVGTGEWKSASWVYGWSPCRESGGKVPQKLKYFYLIISTFLILQRYYYKLKIASSEKVTCWTTRQVTKISVAEGVYRSLVLQPETARRGKKVARYVQMPKVDCRDEN